MVLVAPIEVLVTTGEEQQAAGVVKYRRKGTTPITSLSFTSPVSLSFSVQIQSLLTIVDVRPGSDSAD